MAQREVEIATKFEIVTGVEEVNKVWFDATKSKASCEQGFHLGSRSQRGLNGVDSKEEDTESTARKRR